MLSETTVIEERPQLTKPKGNQQTTIRGHIAWHFFSRTKVIFLKRIERTAAHFGMARAQLHILNASSSFAVSWLVSQRNFSFITVLAYFRGPLKTTCFYAFPSCQVGEAVIFKAERWLFSHGLSRSFLISRSSAVFCSFPSLRVPIFCSFNPPVESRADYAL